MIAECCTAPNRRPVKECAERARLANEFGVAASEFITGGPVQRWNRITRNGARYDPGLVARARTAWENLGHHLRVHECLRGFENRGDLPEQESASPLSREFPEIVLIVNDDRQFVCVNEIATRVLGLDENELLGNRVDDFFTNVNGMAVPPAWVDFVADGLQVGICEAIGTGRKFAYRARANIAPGFHLSILREL